MLGRVRFVRLELFKIQLLDEISYQVMSVTDPQLVLQQATNLDELV